MNTTRDLNKIGWGEIKTYYEIVKRDNKNMEAFWRKLGLVETFRKFFPTDQNFWNSDQSLFDIFKMLKAKQVSS